MKNTREKEEACRSKSGDTEWWACVGDEIDGGLELNCRSMTAWT
jgi:hypothetical protein